MPLRPRTPTRSGSAASASIAATSASTSPTGTSSPVIPGEHDLGNRLDGRRDRRELHQARLDQHRGHAVAAAARQHDDVGGSVRRDRVRFRPREDDTLRSDPRRERAERRFLGSGSGDEQLRARATSGRFDREVHTLLRDERTRIHEGEPRFVELEHAPRVRSLGRGDRDEPIRDDAVRDHRDAIGTHTEVHLQRGRRSVPERDDARGTRQTDADTRSPCRTSTPRTASR